MKAYIQHRHKDSDKLVLQALVPFTSLKDHAIFTCKANPQYTDNAKQLAQENVAYYQRRIDNSRISEIQRFIISSILEERNNISIATLFPSSMIIALPIDDEEQLQGDDTIDISFDRNVFIVDGQHRLMAMVLLYQSLVNGFMPQSDDLDYVRNYLENYKFNCTVLVNFDLWEQGQVFINVNFKQKPVNKSLYYEVFGSEYREGVKDDKRNKIYLAHCLVKELNTNNFSPFYGKIKMLGTGKGYISQAFIVEALLLNFKVHGIWWKSPTNDAVADRDYNSYRTELLTFFKAVYDAFKSYWPTDEEPKATLICKTTAVGALLRLMSYIHNAEDFDYAEDFKDIECGNICKPYYDYVLKLLNPITESAENLFGKKSEFANASGKGWESRMYNRFVSIINRDKDVQLRNDDIEIFSKYNPDNKIVISIDDVIEKLRDYYWTNEDSELSSLSHHYEFEDLDNVHIQSVRVNEGKLLCIIEFDSIVTLYLDNEDDYGVQQVFPTKAEVNLTNENGEWNIDPVTIKTHFDTSNY